jgi:hypothetical protein
VPLPTDFAKCIADDDALDLPLSSVDPFMALHFNFGMLLGVTDFEAQQAYHRGKSRLHNAWLHGPGVVWGLGVSIDFTSSEVRVEAGLALDGAGHELYLDAPACVDVGAWYSLHQNDAAVMAVATHPADGVTSFKSYVVARFRPCLTREVPALSEPCEGSNTDTAFSRVAETIQLDLVAGDPPARGNPDYECTQILLGLRSPRNGTDGQPLKDHKAAADERARIAALPADQRSSALMTALQQFIAIDAIDRLPASDAAGNRLLFPAADDEGIVLATLDAMTLQRQGTGWTLTNTVPAPAVHYERRDTLMPTGDLQYLIALLLGANPVAVQGFAGPWIVGLDIPDKKTVQLTADKALDADVVADGTAFSVTSKTAGGRWTASTFAASLGADGKTITLTLNADLPDASVVRVIAHGTGAAPLVGADGVPLGAAGVGDADGQDFVGTKTRS